MVVIRSEPVSLQTELPGRTNPFTVSEVRPQVSGIVLSREFQEGSNVRQGQVLYRIDPATYRAAVAQAQGQLANAEANLTTTRLRAERYADLVKINAVSRQDYDDAAAAYGQARAAVQQSRGALQTAQINLGYTDVRAPISGRIGRSVYTKGALVTANQTDALTTIQQLDPMYVDLSQSSAELLRLRADVARGQVQRGGPLAARVRLMLEDGSTYPLDGRLQFTDVTVDPNSGTVDLRVVVPNPAGVLLPGMYVRAQIVEGVDPAGILAPQQGVTRDPKGDATALVVNAQGKAEQRQLQVVRAIGDKWLVNQGLAPGDRLIVEGLQRVRPGMAVRAVPAGSPARPGPANGAGAPGGGAGPGPQGGGRPATDASAPASPQTRAGPSAAH